MSAVPVFPNYMQLPRRVPLRVWQGVRVVSVTAMIGVILLLFVRPRDGLTLFWGVAVPLLPLSLIHI